MPFNGSGTYSLPQSPFVAGTVISSSAVNDDFSDIADALSSCLTRDGQAGMTGQLTIIDGSVSTPSLGFNNEDNTGFYLPAVNTLGVVVNGVSVGTFTSLGWTGNIPSGCPIGTVVDFAGTSIPAGWLAIYGQNVSRSTYASLFTALSTTYGSGDGVTTFGLPDGRGTIFVGKNDMGGVASSYLNSTYYGADPNTLGTRGGGQSKTLVTLNLPAYTPSGSIGIVDPGHNHAYSIGQLASVYGGGGFAALGANVNTFTSTNLTGITGTFAGAAQGGTSTPLSLVQPSLIVNKIIYVGV